MTEKIRSTIILKKIVIRDYNNKIVYDESFQKGVNIIRGTNSSGKSTISNFIFFILGGAYNNWTSESLKCKDVTAEILINNALFTLRREITSSPIVPLQIFWGDYYTANSNNLNWKVFPYKQTENIISFSNALFNALNFPEVKGDLDSNITMHQILRLLYIDQLTPPQSLFRYENFDPPLTRKTVSEILLGTYDDTLYTDRLSLRDNQKKLEVKDKEYRNLITIINHSGFSISRQIVEKDLEKIKENLQKNEEDLDKLKTTELKTTKKSETSTEKIKQELTEQKKITNNTITKINQYDLEIADSKQFISTLEKRILDLNNSISTRKLIGDLSLTHCPQCLGELSSHSDESICFLCKQPLEEEAEKANAKRLLQEMQLQVIESKRLLEIKEKIYNDLNSTLPELREKLRFLQKELDKSIDTPQTTRDERIDRLLIKKGFIESQIEHLARHLKMIEVLESLTDNINELNKGIKLLKLNISEKEKSQEYRYSKVINRIKEITISILRKDLPRQDEFKTGKIIEIDFFRDTFTLDGGNNFSASSKTYFKNAILFSIFFASLEFSFMRYPRFILCDNMEDKGMEKERTQNFQELITQMSDSYLEKGIEHQIIFTTSMISDKLNNTKYCIGEYYNTDKKTLKI
ncbi:hypothetical protein [Chryseobacterium bernardetii]|uniref:hypothetical protein n=1 Tax=Chryseobacterium bernardetii TaxID=1241978 RepID=UPI00301893FE